MVGCRLLAVWSECGEDVMLAFIVAVQPNQRRLIYCSGAIATVFWGPQRFLRYSPFFEVLFSSKFFSVHSEGIAVGVFTGRLGEWQLYGHRLEWHRLYDLSRESIGTPSAHRGPAREVERMSSASQETKVLVGIIMGSRSDWRTLRHASCILDELQVPHECKIVSAHRTPDWMCQYAKTARQRGLHVIIAGAGGAAHLPGMVAAQTTLPVLGVPVRGRELAGADSLLSIVQMPGGVPVGTLAIGKAGAINAALLAARILALHDAALEHRLEAYVERMRQSVLGDQLP